MRQVMSFVAPRHPCERREMRTSAAGHARTKCTEIALGEQKAVRRVELLTMYLTDRRGSGQVPAGKAGHCREAVEGCP
jgi:hypothetical protein